jgi:Flp pilus assembly protein TadD
MSEVPYPDRHHLNAATGWLELGALDEARRELARLQGDHLFHPEVLAVRWKLFAQLGEWKAALEIARLHVRIAPDTVEPWIHQSFALHELQRTDEAFNELKQVADTFAEEGTIPYNLACYTCRLGRLDEARRWLQRACSLQGRKETLALAATDPDLAAMRDQLRNL